MPYMIIYHQLNFIVCDSVWTDLTQALHGADFLKPVDLQDLSETLVVTGLQL